MHGRRACAAAVVALALGLSMAACSASGPPSIVGKQTLRIGVKEDQPGLGLRLPDGRFAGFYVDVALYVAAKLDVRPDHITFVPVTSALGKRHWETARSIWYSRPIRSPRASDEGHLRRAVLRGPSRHHGPRHDTAIRSVTTSRESGYARSQAPTPGSVSRSS
jgi:hypothetical protein